MRNLRDEARFDAYIHDQTLRHLGVVEPDEPTEASHRYWMDAWEQQTRGEFTADERQKIRLLLGLTTGDCEAVATEEVSS